MNLLTRSLLGFILICMPGAYLILCLAASIGLHRWWVWVALW
jgi:hypothetical protein